MIKKVFAAIFTALIILNISSCALLKKPIDDKTGFSDHLKQTEAYIRNEEWGKAKTSLEDSIKIWKELKPLLQIDIDHDYVNNIEDDFIKLNGYIDTREKPDSLATILIIQDTWENIGSL